MFIEIVECNNSFELIINIINVAEEKKNVKIKEFLTEQPSRDKKPSRSGVQDTSGDKL